MKALNQAELEEFVRKNKQRIDDYDASLLFAAAVARLVQCKIERKALLAMKIKGIE
jgi:hypothetical protein